MAAYFLQQTMPFSLPLENLTSMDKVKRIADRKKEWDKIGFHWILINKSQYCTY